TCTRRPVARSMSSAERVSSRLTAEPTVPYPRRATRRSADGMGLLALADVQLPELCPDLLELGLGEPAAVLVQHRLPALHLGDPALCERAVADRGEDAAHVLAHVLVDDLGPDVVRAVLGRVGDR